MSKLWNNKNSNQIKNKHTVQLDNKHIKNEQF